MTISLNYKKRKNINLFNKFQTNKQTNLDNVQNYIPIYEKFFSLNNTNWNSINLNHQWAISDIKDTKHKVDDNEHIFHCKLKHISDDEDVSNSQKIFIKMAPLLDPFKYLVGKYNYNDSQLFNLPSFDKSVKVHPKITDPNNSSFVDGFFAYLTSKILHEHQFIHGLDYYGSFLAIKNDYKINIIDDIDYLIQSEFFNKQKGVLFTVEDYSHLITNNEVKLLQPLKITTSLKSVLSVKSIDDNIFENIFDNKSTISLNDIKNIGIELEDITNSKCFDVSNQKRSETLRSDSTCSSRSSHTNDNDLTNSQEEDDDTLSKHITKSTNSKIFTSLQEELTSELNDSSIGHNNEGDEDEDEDDSDTSTSTIEEESITLTLPKFPVQVICMENCENTFDDLIVNHNLTDDEWFSALMQIIMILITYQKMFSFTHNDLHTNNVMYIPTNKKFIYYTYKKKTYKVPTFGKIYKLIDFGRAIYKFNGKLFCSDSFQNGEDAATQYNTEPYFNDKKPRLEPNFSFDLCRLACSIFDYIVDDFDTIKTETSPLVKLIIEWCIDDNGINILYKNNGVERYPDFKLYKMIVRCVHNHTPQSQLDRKEFSKYLILNKNIPKNEFIINIDELPSYI